MDAAGGGPGDENFRLAIGKLIAWTEGMNTARRENSARAQCSGEEDSRPCLRYQDETILPGEEGAGQKLLAGPGNAILLNGVWKYRQSGDWRSQVLEQKRVLAVARTLFRCGS